MEGIMWKRYSLTTEVLLVEECRATHHNSYTLSSALHICLTSRNVQLHRFMWRTSNPHSNQRSAGRSLAPRASVPTGRAQGPARCRPYQRYWHESHERLNHSMTNIQCMSLISAPPVMRARHFGWWLTKNMVPSGIRCNASVYILFLLRRVGPPCCRLQQMQRRHITHIAIRQCRS